VNKVLGADKKKLLSNVAGKVVEIGIGSGGNLRYYPEEVEVIGIEPNAAMRKYIERSAKTFGIDIIINECSAEELPFDAESIDTVVATHVMCSVQSVQQSLSEILRILKPGGQYHYIEHVAAKKGTPLRFIQNTVRRVHSAVFGGCQCNREIGIDIKDAGFTIVDYTKKNLGNPLSHIKPHIVGTAMK